MSRRRGGFLAGWLLLLLLGLPGRAAAHAFLVSSEPAAGAVLLQAPAAVVLHFTEDVAPGLSTFAVYDSRRDQVSGPARVAGRTVTVPLGSLPPGTYTLRWSVVSADDGHPTSGSLLFSVWRGGPLPAAAGAGAATAAGGVQGGAGGSLARLAVLLSAFALVGATFVALALGFTPPGAAWAGPAAVAALAAAFVVQGAAAVGVAPLPFLAGGYAALALAAPFGRQALLAAAGAALAAAGLGLRRRLLALAGSLALVAGLALASHPAASAQPVLGAAVDGLHLAATAAWGGGLGWLLARRADLLPRFAPWALGLVAAIVVTGSADALFTVHAAAALLHTLYGHVLDVKLALFGGVLAAAAATRRGLRGGRLPVRALAAEAVLGLGVVAAAAVLVGAPPAAVAGPGGATVYRAERRVGGLTVQLAVSPLLAGVNQVTVRLDPAGDYAALPLTVASLDMDMGATTVTLPARGGGVYGAQTAVLSMAGTWRLTVAVGGQQVPFTVTVGTAGGGQDCTYGFDPGLHARVIDLHDAVRAIAARGPDVLVAGAAGAHLSRDDGASWRTALAGTSLVAAAMAPDGSAWYVAAADGLWRSRDGGASWQALAVPGPGVAALLAGDGGRLWLAAADGLYAGDGSGRQAWTRLAGADAVGTITSLTTVGPRLLAGSLRGILVSDDGGRTWRVAAPAAQLVYGFALDAAHAGTVWAAAMQGGIWVSRDGGASWQRSDQGLAVPATMGVAVWGGGRDLLAATMGGGLAASDDYGASWQNAACPAAVVDALAATTGPTLWVGDGEGVVRLQPGPGR